MTAESIHQGVVVEMDAPLGWAPQPQNPADPAAANERLLQLLLGLDETRPERSDSHHELHAEMLRLEMKLDLILELLTQAAVTGSSSTPAPRSIRLSASAIDWREAGSGPAVDQRLRLDLYLDPRLPGPLTLPVRIVSVLPTDDSTVCIGALFEQMPETTALLFERYIFQQHRRAIARLNSGR